MNECHRAVYLVKRNDAVPQRLLLHIYYYDHTHRRIPRNLNASTLKTLLEI